MNWRRGTLRLLIVASICWTGVVACILYQDFAIVSASNEAQSAANKACADERTTKPSLGNPFDCFENGPISLRVWPITLKLLVLPIAGAFLGWFALVWAFAGFARTAEKR
jgi:hypothetical protein